MPPKPVESIEQLLRLLCAGWRLAWFGTEVEALDLAERSPTRLLWLTRARTSATATR
jgi:hypothetical protein